MYVYYQLAKQKIRWVLSNIWFKYKNVNLLQAHTKNKFEYYIRRYQDTLWNILISQAWQMPRRQCVSYLWQNNQHTQFCPWDSCRQPQINRYRHPAAATLYSCQEYLCSCPQKKNDRLNIFLYFSYNYTYKISFRAWIASLWIWKYSLLRCDISMTLIPVSP